MNSTKTIITTTVIRAISNMKDPVDKLLVGASLIEHYPKYAAEIRSCLEDLGITDEMLQRLNRQPVKVG